MRPFFFIIVILYFVLLQLEFIIERIEETDFLPALEGRGFPPKGFIVPTIGSGLHPSSGEQSSGSENHSHLKGGTFIQITSSPLKEGRDTGCSSHSLIIPSIELGRSVISVIKRFLAERYLNIRGLSIPALKGEAFRPLNPHFCKAKIIKVHDYSLDILQKHLQYSGFEKVEEWVSAARELRVSSNRSKVVFGELLELHVKLPSLTVRK